MSEAQVIGPEQTENQTTAPTTLTPTAQDQAAASPETNEDIVNVSGDVVTRMFERDVSVLLTDSQVAELALKAAELAKECSDLEKEKKQAVSEFNTKINKKIAECSAILEKIRAGETLELKMVKEVRDYNSATVKVYDADRLVEERAMTADELQKDLFLRGTEEPATGLTEAQFERKLMDEARGGKTVEYGDESMATTPVMNPALDLKQVIREETGVRTKHSAVDGPTL